MKIKPHHFVDIIKLYGTGLEVFVLDATHQHDFYRVANTIMHDPNTRIQLTTDADEICQPCLSLVDEQCQDFFSGISKERYNKSLDLRLIKHFEFSLEKEYTALQLCMLLYYQKELIPFCWSDEDSEKLAFRMHFFSTGAKKYIAKYALPLEENESFRAGVMDAFCEIVKAGVKHLAFSHATNNEQLFLKDLQNAYAIAQKYGVHFYLEKNLIQTALFKNSGQMVLIFYSDASYLEAYLALKKAPQKTMEEKVSVAKSLGELLSYNPSQIDKMIQQSLEEKSI